MSDVIRLDSEIKALILEYRKSKLRHMYLNYLKLKSLTKDEGIIEITNRLINDFKSKSDKDILKDVLSSCIEKYKEE